MRLAVAHARVETAQLVRYPAYALPTLAFPAISTGIYGYPADAAAEIAVHETQAALAENAALDCVTFALFSDDQLAIYQALIGAG